VKSVQSAAEKSTYNLISFLFLFKVLMKNKLLFFLFIISFNIISQTEEKKEYIILANGEKLEAQIKKVRPKYIKAKVGPVDREFPAELIKSFYSKDYNTVFESHKIGKKNKNILLGIYRDGEVITLCELKNMVAKVTDVNYNSNINGTGFGGFFYSTHKEKSGLWTLEGKTYFRHKDEPPETLHEANKKEFLNVKLYECFPLMIKLVNSLNDLDLSRNIRDQTYRDLIVKYNNECEAKLREKAEEREKGQR